MPSNPLTQQELYDYGILRTLDPPDYTDPSAYFPAGYFLVPPHDVNGPVLWRKFHAEYIQEGLIDPDRLGTGYVGAGNLYLADDGIWKAVPIPVTPNLQQVTDVGSTTTNAITTNGVTSDFFTFDTSATPTPVTGMMFWDQDSQTPDVQLDSVLSAKMFQDEFWYVKNQTGSTITKGTVVMAAGTLGASSRILVAPMIANGSVSPKFILGIAAENIPDGEDGSVMRVGKIRNLNTTAFTAGDVLYANPAVPGGLTNVLPSAPNLKLAVAFVVHSATNGVLAVRVEIGSDLYEDHRVQVTSPTDGQLLRYDNTDQRWENWTPNFLTSFTETDPIFTASPSFGITSTLINNWNTAYNNRITSLTTIGSSGASTLVSNVLNIPNYTLAGLGGQPALSGTGFVKISGATISYDNSTYYLASNPNGYTTNVGTVTSIAASTGLTGGTITTSGTIALADTAVTPGAYTNADITVDAQGRIIEAANGAGAPSGFTGTFTVSTNPPGQQTLDIVNGIIVNVF